MLQSVPGCEERFTKPGKPGSKNGGKPGKPSEGSEPGDQDAQPESVAKDDEGTVFDRIKKALEKKQQEEPKAGQDHR